MPSQTIRPTSTCIVTITYTERPASRTLGDKATKTFQKAETPGFESAVYGESGGAEEQWGGQQWGAVRGGGGDPSRDSPDILDPGRE